MLDVALKYAKKFGWPYIQIGFFIVSLQLTNKSTVIAGLIIWLILVSTSLGLMNLNKVLKEI